MQETWVPSLDWGDPLEKGMATHTNSPAWRIPCTEEPGGLQSMGSQRVGHDWSTNTSTFRLPGSSCGNTKKQINNKLAISPVINNSTNQRMTSDPWSVPSVTSEHCLLTWEPSLFTRVRMDSPSPPFHPAPLSPAHSPRPSSSFRSLWWLQWALVSLFKLRGFYRGNPVGGNGNPLQYSCLDNPTDRGAWWAIVHGSHRRAVHDLATKTT